MAVLRAAFRAGKDRFGFRLVHYSVQSNHVHLICEAADKESLSKGLQGLGVRIARGLNKLWGRKGKVFDDRYHAQVLSNPRQVRWALGYVLNNTRKHNAELLVSKNYAKRWLDQSCTSVRYFPGFIFEGEYVPAWPVDEDAPVMEPKVYLLRVGWERWGPIPTDHVPGERRSRT